MRREKFETALVVDVNDLIPQKGSMRLVDKLIYNGEEERHVLMTVPRESPFVNENDVLEEVAFLEIVAQALAAQIGFENLQSQKEPKGLLIGCKNFKIFGQAKSGDVLTIKTVTKERFGNFGIIDGHVYKDEKLLAYGEVKVWNENK